MEHRWGQRVVVDVPIRLVGGPFSGGSARLTNLSVSGGCIKSGFELRLLSRVDLSIELLRFTQATPLLMAYVTRKFKSGVGIEWCEFAPPAISELIRAATPRRYGYPRRSMTLAKGQPDSAPALTVAPHASPAARGPEAALGPEAARGGEPSRAPQVPSLAAAPRALLKHGT